jgi:hypothetical protein
MSNTSNFEKKEQGILIDVARTIGSTLGSVAHTVESATTAADNAFHRKPAKRRVAKAHAAKRTVKRAAKRIVKKARAAKVSVAGKMAKHTSRRSSARRK